MANGMTGQDNYVSVREPAVKIDVGQEIEICGSTWKIEEFGRRLEKREALLFLQEVAP